ncbi:hypothetical protein Moror_16516 [Moniliophthora roreri MCA 2997]|uniref:Uncharacterized protein n=1 Tax=Moniliophthora roreri (strain MCA 2997) TaxID=1381753 RepID=V2XE82_MONRO|nr:hypothetical protein Moror_16516 [Moniliophthora roreri MCA 2997]
MATPDPPVLYPMPQSAKRNDHYQYMLSIHAQHLQGLWALTFPSSKRGVDYASFSPFASRSTFQFSPKMAIVVVEACKEMDSSGQSPPGLQDQLGVLKRTMEEIVDFIKNQSG